MNKLSPRKRFVTGLAILSFLGFASCEGEENSSEEAQAVAEPEVEEVVDIKAIDREAGAMAREHGLAKTVPLFFAEDAIQLDDGKEMIDDGIFAIMLDHEATIPENLAVSWVPLGGEVAESGDLAYTWGRWENIRYPENGGMITTYGKYVTVWKKQDDGSWKVVVDIWNSEDLPDE